MSIGVVGWSCYLGILGLIKLTHRDEVHSILTTRVLLSEWGAILVEQQLNDFNRVTRKVYNFLNKAH